MMMMSLPRDEIMTLCPSAVCRQLILRCLSATAWFKAHALSSGDVERPAAAASAASAAEC